jgi:hypothetical protein
MIEIAAMRAAGLTETQILAMFEQEQHEAKAAAAERLALKREQTRVRNRIYRARKKANEINGRVTHVTRHERHEKNPNDFNGRVTVSPVTNPPIPPLLVETQNLKTESQTRGEAFARETDNSQLPNVIARESGLPMGRMQAVPIPDNWQPSVWTREDLHLRGKSDAEIDFEFPRYRDHCKERAKLVADPDAGFRNWMTNGINNNKGQAQNGYQRPESEWNRQQREWRETREWLAAGARDRGGVDGKAIEILPHQAGS